MLLTYKGGEQSCSWRWAPRARIELERGIFKVTTWEVSQVTLHLFHLKWRAHTCGRSHVRGVARQLFLRRPTQKRRQRNSSSRERPDLRRKINPFVAAGKKDEKDGPCLGPSLDPLKSNHQSRAPTLSPRLLHCADQFCPSPGLEREEVGKETGLCRLDLTAQSKYVDLVSRIWAFHLHKSNPIWMHTFESFHESLFCIKL